jgi:glycosyltransferase involved in cell wall biosynthesis
MVKFLFFAPRFHTNQVNVVKELTQAGFNISFHVERISKIEDHSILVPFLIPTKNIAIYSRKIQVLNILRYYYILKEEQFSHIVIRDPNRLNAIIVALLSRLLGIQILFYTQMIINKNYPFIRRILYNSIILLFNAKWYSPVFGKRDESFKKIMDKLYYIPFPTSLNKPFSYNHSSDNFINILSVGKFQERKNHLLLVRVIEFLAKIYSVKLKIIGEVTTQAHKIEYDKIQAYIKERGLIEVIQLVTNVKPSSMEQYYLGADFFVLPSYNEPASISILEAMSFCLPVVVSNDCGNRDYVIHGVTGYHFKKNNFWSLLECIHSLLKERQKREYMSKQTEQLVLNEFSEDSFLKAFKSMINDK